MSKGESVENGIIRLDGLTVVTVVIPCRMTFFKRCRADLQIQL
jgi:hypothetical protein